MRYADLPPNLRALDEAIGFATSVGRLLVTDPLGTWPVWFLIVLAVVLWWMVSHPEARR